MKLLAILSLFLIAGTAWAKEVTAQIKVNGMTCDACAVSVKAALQQKRGVRSVDVSVEKGLATVVYDDSQVNDQQLRDAISNRIQGRRDEGEEVMSDCCSTTKDGICSVSADKPGFCPACGKKGNSVATLTVKSLVRDHTRVNRSGSYSLCRTPDCDVVYFSDSATFRKAELKVRVGIKEIEDPVPLCYCFEYGRADIRRDVEELGSTKIPDEIKAEIQGGFCACEVKNPSGSCCLGDITRAVHAAKSAEHVGAR